MIQNRYISLSFLLFGLLGQAQADPEARFRGPAKADPVRIENVKRLDPVADHSAVTFDLAWDHSWRAAWSVPAEQHGGVAPLQLESWDAAWVFAKFRKPGDDGWSHATLSTGAADHAVPDGATLQIGPSDDGQRGLGVFVYRATAGSGANDFKGVRLRWLHGADGIKDPGTVDLKIFAIQMVYVPQCAFWLGDGANNDDPAGRFCAGDTDAPFRIESEDAIVLGGDHRKNLGNHDGLGMERAEDFTSSGAQILPARFPKGFAAFYCMRHEITEGQYVDFLNTLSAQRQQHLKPLENSPTGIKLLAPGKTDMPRVYQTDRPHVACNGFLWKDCGVFAAWAGLRAMTEMEFEKACRGPLKPVPNEYAWGTAGIAGKDFDKLFPSATHGGYVVKNRGQSEENAAWRGDNNPDATRGNAVWYGAIRREGPEGRHGRAAADAIKGPLRVGIFATPRSGRVEAGASYWGILDLSGNLWERVMTVGNRYGRRFTGAHGQWLLDKGPEGYGMGTGIRGGTHAPWIAEVTEPAKDSRRLRISDREKVSRITPIHRGWNGSRAGYWSMGFRCVRTAEIRQPLADPPTAQDVSHLRAPILDRHSAAGGETIRRVADWLDWKVEVQNLTITPRDEKAAVLTFDVAWKDSWRDEHKHDAAWLFFKVRANDKSPWQHVRLAADRVLNPAGYGQAKGGTRLDFLVPDGDDGFTGLFLRRATDGEGALAANRVKVVWDFAGSTGIAKDLKGVSIRPFGIRMVYVPAGPFHLGSGGLEPGGFYQYSDGSQHIEPYQVTGPGAIPTGRQASKLWARKHGGQLQDGGEISASFPNGFSAFYCMKHQIAPAQYAAFLNTLPQEQADERFAGQERWAVPRQNGQKAKHGRVHYSGGQGQVFRSDDGYSSKAAQARAGPGCFGLSWADFAAWAGLRPMTELELEKAVRGRRKPVPDEVGPSYWGIGGFNTWDWNAFKHDTQSERAVTVGNATGRRFKGTHGRGTLTIPADWPQADAIGSGMRCTHYNPRVGRFDHNWNIQRSRLSDRLLAAVADPARCPSHKWRGVRTAPRIEKTKSTSSTPTDATFMPRGVYWPGEFLFKKNGSIDWPRVEAALDDLEKHHVNAVWLTHCSAGDAAAFARRAARRGIYVVASLSELAGEVERVRRGDHQALIDRTLASWGAAPKPIAWGLGDEPRAAYMHEMAAYAKAWKRHAPGAKLTTAVMHQDVASASTVGFDFLCADIYPYFSDRNPNSFGVPSWQAWLQNVRKLRAATPRPWMMGQGFQEPWGPYEVTPQGNIAYLAGGAPHWVMPTPSQVSWQTHSAVAEGAKGVFFFLYRWPVSSKASAARVNLPAAVKQQTDSGAPIGLVYPDGRPTQQYKAMGRSFAWLARHAQRLAPLEPIKGAEVWEGGRKNHGHVVSLLAHPRTGARFLMIVAASAGSGPVSVGAKLNQPVTHLTNLDTGRPQPITTIGASRTTIIKLKPGTAALFECKFERDGNSRNRGDRGDGSDG